MERIICLTIVGAIYIVAIGFHIFAYNRRYFLAYVLTVVAASVIGGLVEVGRQRLRARQRDRDRVRSTEAPATHLRYTA